MRGLGPILDLRQKLWLDPDSLVCDPLGVRLRLADQGLQPLLQVGSGRFVEAVIDLAGVDEVIAGFALDGSKWDGIYLGRRKGNARKRVEKRLGR